MFWEMIGYLGTALVIISMLMTNIDKLRFINICGGLLSLIYAISANTMPIVLLNITLVTINIVQLIRSKIGKSRESAYVEGGARAENNEKGETYEA